MNGGTARPGRWLLASLALLGAAAAVVASRLQPPAPVPADGPAAAFSAGRALELLGRIDPDGAPRPIGSAAHERARRVIVEELRRLGLAPEVQETFACGIYGTCATVRNVLARTGGGRSVLLMAHYDTVPAGPGAGDDGAGVAAVLEMARALLARPPPRPIIVLIDDGEEGGLIGAAAFLAEHPWAKDVGAVVNLEARGTAGPSLLFEITGGSAFPAALARSVPRPVTGSFFAGIYQRLPNDTDLSLFRPLGLPGVNLAFIGEGERYHTSGDDRAHLDPGSVQHQGETALAMARAFASGNLEEPPRGDAVFFDVLSVGVVAWPASGSLPLAAAGLLVSLGAAALARRRAGWKALVLGLGAFAAGPLLGAAAAMGLRLLLAAAGALPRPWVAHPAAALAAFSCAGIAAAAGATTLARRAGPEALGIATGIGFSALALVAASALPAASYLLIVPALAAGGAALAAAAVPALAGPAAVAASLAAAMVLLPVVWLLQLALGVLGSPAFAALPAMVVAPLAPFLAGLGDRARKATWVPIGATIGAAVLAAFLPHASAARPQATTLVFHQDAASMTARWLLVASDERLPEPMRRAAPFSGRAQRVFGWDQRSAFAAVAPALSVPGPELQIVETSRRGSLREVRTRLRSPRRARDAMLLIPPGSPVVAVEIGGRPAPADPKVRRLISGYGVARCLGLPPEGVEITLTIEGEAKVPVEVLDLSSGLPPGGERLVAARPSSGVPFQDGDATVMTRRVSL